MKIFYGKAIIGYTVEVEDDTSMEEIKQRIADGMGWEYFTNFEPEEIFDIVEVPNNVSSDEE